MRKFSAKFTSSYTDVTNTMHVTCEVCKIICSLQTCAIFYMVLPKYCMTCNTIDEIFISTRSNKTEQKIEI